MSLWSVVWRRAEAPRTRRRGGGVVRWSPRGGAAALLVALLPHAHAWAQPPLALTGCAGRPLGLHVAPSLRRPAASATGNAREAQRTLEGVDADLAWRLRVLAFQWWWKTGEPLEIAETHRTAARQAWLYASGRTRRGPLVTAIASGSSHERGAAVDLWLPPRRWPRARLRALWEMALPVGLRPTTFWIPDRTWQMRPTRDWPHVSAAWRLGPDAAGLQPCGLGAPGVWRVAVGPHQWLSVTASPSAAGPVVLIAATTAWRAGPRRRKDGLQTPRRDAPPSSRAP